MKKFLSLLLSICLFTNTLIPSFALPAPEINPGLLGKMLRIGGQDIARAASMGMARQIAGNAMVKMYVNQIPTVTLKLSLPPVVNTYAVQFQQGQFSGLGKNILALPVDIHSTVLMRNEVVGLALMQELSSFEVGQAVSFYQEQLSKSATIFAAIPKGETLSSLSQRALEAGVTEDGVGAAFGMIADAVALGLTGSKKDIASLMEFYQGAKGTVFEGTASMVVGRNLLRWEAFDELNDFIVREKPQGQFWANLPSYAKLHNLDLISVEQTAPASAFPKEFTNALTLYTSFADLASDTSLFATRIAVSMGKSSFWNGLANDQERSRLLSTIRKGKTIAQQAEERLMDSPVGGAQDGSIEPLYLTPMQNVPPAQSVTKQLTGEETPLITSSQFQKPSSFTQWVSSHFRKKRLDDRVSFPASVMNAAGEKRALPITFSIGPSFKIDGYNEIVFREDLRFENGYIIELHDHGKEPAKLNHFYMELYTNDVGALVRAAQKANTNLRLKLESAPSANYERISKELYDETTGLLLPVELDVQLDTALWAREAKQSFSHWIESLGMPGTYKANPFTDAKFFLRKNGEIGVQFKGLEEIVPLPEGYYIRLPKNQVQQLIKMEPFLVDGTHFEVIISPTVNRVNMVSRDAQLTNVSLGKTMGPVVNGSLGISEASAKSLMFGINYVLPGFASMLTPVLKKYGEKNLLTLSLGMSVGAGALATAGGFYGFVENMTLGPVQKGMFVTALFLMSGASIIKQLVSNMLIAANRGEVVLTKAEKAVAEEVTKGNYEGFKLIAHRVKEFFTKKSTVSLSALAKYNEGFIYKNIGTLAFLASPFAINYGIKLVTGVDLGLDYSISFPLYAGYSAYVAWKILGSKLRDAYTAKNLIQSQQMVRNMIDTGAAALMAEEEVSHTVINDVARSFKDSLDALAFAHIKLDPSKNKKLLYSEAKEKVLAALENKLIEEYGMVPADAAQLMTRLSAALKVQENNFGNMWTMFRAPGVASLMFGMIAATTHEFVISSSFSGMMKELISQGELANFLIASSLYIPLIAGRLGGNWISRRISPDSMYIFCSTLSAAGTAIMATAGGSVSQTITGAVVASLGVGNFFTQMYDYIMRRYPKQNRELSSLLALTMGVGGLAAIPAGYMAGQMGMGVPVDLMYAAGMLGASLLLTPKMMQNSSFIVGLKQEAQRLWKGFKGLFRRRGDNNPGAGISGGDPATAQ